MFKAIQGVHEGESRDVQVRDGGEAIEAVKELQLGEQWPAQPLMIVVSTR